MNLFDMIPDVGKYIKIFESIASAMKRISEDTGIKDKYKTTGVVSGHLTLYDNYELDFRFRNTAVTNQQAIPAEIVEHTEETNNAD